MACWHKYPKEWTDDTRAVYRNTDIPAREIKRCTKCKKLKWRQT